MLSERLGRWRPKTNKHTGTLTSGGTTTDSYNRFYHTLKCKVVMYRAMIRDEAQLSSAPQSGFTPLDWLCISAECPDHRTSRSRSPSLPHQSNIVGFSNHSNRPDGFSSHPSSKRVTALQASCKSISALWTAGRSSEWKSCNKTLTIPAYLATDGLTMSGVRHCLWQYLCSFSQGIASLLVDILAFIEVLIRTVARFPSHRFLIPKMFPSLRRPCLKSCSAWLIDEQMCISVCQVISWRAGMHTPYACSS